MWNSLKDNAKPEADRGGELEVSGTREGEKKNYTVQVYWECCVVSNTTALYDVYVVQNVYDAS